MPLKRLTELKWKWSGTSSARLEYASSTSVQGPSPWPLGPHRRANTVPRGALQFYLEHELTQWNTSNTGNLSQNGTEVIWMLFSGLFQSYLAFGHGMVGEGNAMLLPPSLLKVDPSPYMCNNFSNFAKLSSSLVQCQSSWTETSSIITVSPPTHPPTQPPGQVYLSHFETTKEAEIWYGSFIQPNWVY